MTELEKFDLMLNPQEAVLKRALEEVAEEIFRESVEKQKAKLRDRRSLWARIFPWKIEITRRIGKDA